METIMPNMQPQVTDENISNEARKIIATCCASYSGSKPKDRSSSGQSTENGYGSSGLSSRDSSGRSSTKKDAKDTKGKGSQIVKDTKGKGSPTVKDLKGKGWARCFGGSITIFVEKCKVEIRIKYNKNHSNAPRKFIPSSPSSNSGSSGDEEAPPKKPWFKDDRQREDPPRGRTNTKERQRLRIRTPEG
ncbi:unnamed protein product [Calypogeia fissa]